MQSEITIEQFGALDLRLACITNVEDVPEANKLLKLTLDLGDGVTKTCFAGIKQHYTTYLVGSMVVFVNNLKPRQMKFGLSEGMILAASNGDHSKLAMLTVDKDREAEPGWKVS